MENISIWHWIILLGLGAIVFLIWSILKIFKK
ncbi:Uncharacterised protein [Chlamydia trachomatis]|nr:Uncharacterised protein [Chlamydia trachomatis]